MTTVDAITQWRENWLSASVVNHTIVTNPTIRQPGFDLPRHTWSLMNSFWTGQGHVVMEVDFSCILIEVVLQWL